MVERKVETVRIEHYPTSSQVEIVVEYEEEYIEGSYKDSEKVLWLDSDEYEMLHNLIINNQDFIPL